MGGGTLVWGMSELNYGYSFDVTNEAMTKVKDSLKVIVLKLNLSETYCRSRGCEITNTTM